MALYTSSDISSLGIFKRPSILSVKPEVVDEDEDEEHDKSDMNSMMTGFVWSPHWNPSSS